MIVSQFSVSLRKINKKPNISSFVLDCFFLDFSLLLINSPRNRCVEKQNWGIYLFPLKFHLIEYIKSFKNSKKV